MTRRSDSSDSARKVRGYAIISKGDEPTIIDDMTYLVPSQSSANRKYTVKKGYSFKRWSCNCPDFQKRGLDCKHIFSVRFWLRIKDKIENGEEELIETPQETEITCPYCKSSKFVKNGKRKNDGIEKQTYRCKKCKRYFVDTPFKKIKANSQTVTLIMDLYFKGISLRKIQNHLEQIYGIKITHVTIYSYIKKFTNLIDSYVEQLHPKASNMWHTDEMVVSINGQSLWVWNCMDRDTKFLLSQQITRERDIENAQQTFSDAKWTANSKPIFMVTDGLQAYKQAFKNEFYTNRGDTEHIRGNSFEDNVNNNVVERLHGTLRERVKVARGLKTGNVLKGQKIYYNYVRPHQSLSGLTPAEKSGIKLNLGSNKWLSLIRQASNRV